MPCQDCINLGIPEYLCAEGRPHLDFLDPGDSILRRHELTGNLEDIQALSDSQVGKDLFKLFDDSYNILSLCQHTTDVLFNDRVEDNGAHYSDHGIISLNIGALELQNFSYNQNGVPVICQFKVHHSETPCNYAHAEMIYYMNGQIYRGQSPSKSAKTFFRRTLLKLMNVVKQTAN
jgi:hypothetical protein